MNVNIFKYEDGTPYTGIILINGYEIAERLLEDIIFEADCKDGLVDETTTKVSFDQKNYFEQFNTVKFLAEVTEKL